MSESATYQASCLCSAVKVTVAQINPNFSVCHCQGCRTWGGGPFFAVQCGTDVTFENANIDVLGVDVNGNETVLLDSITVNSESLSSIRIMDLTGKTVQVFNAEQRQLDISNFTVGIYFLEIANAERKSVVKVIKK